MQVHGCKGGYLTFVRHVSWARHYARSFPTILTGAKIQIGIIKVIDGF